MTNREILDYSKKVKAISTYTVYKCLNKINNNIKEKNLKFFIKGGESINYYTPLKDNIETYDFDITIAYINVSKDLDQTHYNKMYSYTEILLNMLHTELTLFFKNNVLKDNFKNLSFTKKLGINRLSTMQFNYFKNNSIYRQIPFIDIFIGNNFKKSVRGKSRQKIFILPHYYDIDYSKPIDKNISEFYKNKIIFKNTYNILLKNKESGIYYITPGDLLLDTQRMVYETIYKKKNIKVEKFNKYNQKLFTLKQSINKLQNICGCSQDCRYDKNLNIIYHNLLNVDCKNTRIYDKDKWQTNKIKQFSKYFILPKDHNIPNIKLCEIANILI